MKQVKKRYSAESVSCLSSIANLVQDYHGDDLSSDLKSMITDSGLGLGKVLPLLRVALCGSMSGPDLFAFMPLIGYQESGHRILSAVAAWNVDLSE